MTRRRPKLMSHAERQKLIQQPFTSQIVISRSWSGTSTRNAGDIPTEGHRTFRVPSFDDSYLRYGKDDDE